MTNIILNPDNNQPSGLINGNKGLIIAVILVVVALLVGFFTFINSPSTGKFQGLIMKVQTANQRLKNK